MSKYEFLIDLNNNESTHTKVAKLVGREKTVLEVGCASGYMSKVLRDEFGCTVYGLELDREDAQAARQYCKEVIEGNIEQLDLSEHFSPKQFDVVIFADVLEHLVDPRATLEKIRPYLDGSLIVSIPNISHAAILYELFQGKFDYTRLGLLDETHKTFFTRSSFESLLRDAGFITTYVDQVRLEAQQTEKATDISLFPPEIIAYIDSLPDSKCYQYVFKAFINEASSRSLEGEILKLQQELKDLRAEEERRRVNTKDEFDRELKRLEKSIHEVTEGVHWYKAKFKELLLINSQLSHEVRTLKRD